MAFGVQRSESNASSGMGPFLEERGKALLLKFFIYLVLFYPSHTEFLSQG